MTRVFGVDGNFVERGVESKVDFVHTLHRESNERVLVLFGTFMMVYVATVSSEWNDENVSQKLRLL